MTEQEKPRWVQITITSISPEIQKELDEMGLSDLAVGDIFIDRQGYYRRIIEIYQSHYSANPDNKKLHVKYVVLDSKGRETQYVRSSEAHYLGKGQTDYVKVRGSIQDLEREALEMLNNEPDEEDNTEQDIRTTDLVVARHGTEHFKDAERNLELRRQRALAMQAVVHRKMWQMREIQQSMERQLKYVRRVLAILETYLGMYQNVLLIQDGQPAPMDTPVAIRQRVLYMDEEVASIQIRNGQRGIDFQSIDVFDAWLLDHYQDIVPEERCIVALRPTRQRRLYSNDPFVQVHMNQENKFIYLVMRNGEKLYRIWDQFTVGEKLFPPEDLYASLIMKMNDEDTHDWDKDKARDAQLDWQQNAVMIEGLLDRTEVMQPLHPHVSLFSEKAYADGLIKLIRDAEVGLPDGHLPFAEWKEAINDRITKGSRIVFAMRNYDVYGRDYPERFGGHYTNNTPSLPANGIYVIEEEKGFRERYVSKDHPPTMRYKFLYQPGGTIWTDWYRDYHERKNRVGFWVEKKDNFVLNYDLIDLDEVLFYINNREERGQYLEILPILYQIYESRMAEMEWEAGFARLFSDRIGVDLDFVLQAIEWWKYKNSIKRSLTEDEAKAWRMIERRAKRLAAGNITDDIEPIEE